MDIRLYEFVFVLMWRIHSWRRSKHCRYILFTEHPISWDTYDV